MVCLSVSLTGLFHGSLCSQPFSVRKEMTGTTEIKALKKCGYIKHCVSKRIIIYSNQIDIVGNGCY